MRPEKASAHKLDSGTCSDILDLTIGAAALAEAASSIIVVQNRLTHSVVVGGIARNRQPVLMR